MPVPYKDLTGQKFGKLTVIELVHKDSNGKYIWVCKCECGRKREVWGKMLKLGKTTSCGSKECRKKGHRKGNKYDFYKDFVIGYDSNNNEFYIDKDDYEKVSSHTWGMTPYGYFSAYCPDEQGNKKTLFLHRFVTDTTDPTIFVDHINHCRHDCRKANLRRLTPSENSKNTIRPTNNNDPYVQAIRKFVIRDHPELGEFKTARDASDFYQRYLIDQLNIRKTKEG